MNSVRDTKFKKPWVIISAYDLSSGSSSEGHVAFNVIRNLKDKYRLIVITRKNNKESLLVDSKLREFCPGVNLVGFDLPYWLSWWKKGARFYQLYAYLWQLLLPLFILSRKVVRQNSAIIHVLNFHNDSIPSLAWILGPPVVWGPINHNELVPSWRRKYWPNPVSVRHLITFYIRRIAWIIDPFLRMQIKKCNAILSAGIWVESRLNIKETSGIYRRSQLGVSADGLGSFISQPSSRANEVNLVCAGRLDWIKGLDIVIESLSKLPVEYRLRILGNGPAKDSLVKLSQEFNLTERVLFEPPVERNRLAEIYADSDVFVFASAEVGGLVWVEALSCGLPVVAFDAPSEISNAHKCIPGIYLAHQYVDRNDNVNSLAKMIEVAGKANINREYIRNEVLKNYQWSSLSSVIEKAYAQALGPPQ